MENRSMNPGEIYLASFPFGGSVGAKVRPVLALTGPLGTVPEVLTAYISGKIPAALLPTDIVLDPTLPDHASTNLHKVSLLRLHKLATIHQSSIVRSLGNLSSTTWAEVQTKLRLLLNLP
jgi:mRNA-degrading endonuclease toxin of MazEF toxin-antitoxin module